VLKVGSRGHINWTGVLAFLLASSALINQGIVAQTTNERELTQLAKQEHPVRLKAELIEVRVVVLDQFGQPVDRLRREDFELLENDRPQEIVFFSVEGAEGGSVRAEGSGVRRSRSPSRTIAVLVDTLHLSFSSLARARQALRKLIEEQILESDLVAIGASDGTLGFEFTQNRQMLLRAVERLTLWDYGLYASRYTPYLAAMVTRGDREALRLAGQIVHAEEGFSDPGYVRSKAHMILSEAAWRRKTTLAMLEAVAERMAEMPGRRILIFISDGFTLMDRGGSMSTGELTQVINRAVRSGITIYSLYARGLEPDRSYGQEELENGLNALASNTGGRAFLKDNDLNLALQQVLTENRISYVLGYYPSEEETSRARRITVRVRGHPEYSVRAPKEYVPLRAKREQVAQAPRQRLFQAVAAPFPTGDLGVAASAKFLEDEADNAQVSLSINLDGSALNPIERDGRYRFELELIVVVYDERGKLIETIARDVEMTLRPGSVERAKQDTYQFVLRMALQPGLHQLRVGVREPSTERIGTAVSWVEVPDLRRKQLRLSSLFLAGQRVLGESPSVEVFRSAAHGPFAEIHEGDDMGCYFAIYNTSAPADLIMQIEIYDHQRRVYQSGWKPIQQWMVGRSRKSVQMIGWVRTGNLPPGLYELRLTIKDPKSKQQAQQATQFEVRSLRGG
jgi:VWFA-related protein